MMDESLFSMLGPGLGIAFMMIGLLIPTVVLLVGIGTMRPGLANSQPIPQGAKAEFYPILWP
jgi:hypothetical protein